MTMIAARCHAPNQPRPISAFCGAASLFSIKCRRVTRWTSSATSALSHIRFYPLSFIPRVTS